MKPLSICLLIVAVVAACRDQRPTRTSESMASETVTDSHTPVKWTISPVAARLSTGDTTSVRVDVQLQAGWHIYAVTQPVAGPTGGPMPTRITLPSDQPFVLAGDPQPTSKPEVKFDDAFRMNVQEHDKNVGFVIPVRLAESSTPADSVHVNVRYQVCNAKLCYPPQTVKLATSAHSIGN
ncbi:MAG: protein-disulfide reductase DsbD N-terminal domain-containing protein [Gemmatimonadaceae bacterium]